MSRFFAGAQCTQRPGFVNQRQTKRQVWPERGASLPARGCLVGAFGPPRTVSTAGAAATDFVSAPRRRTRVDPVRGAARLRLGRGHSLKNVRGAARVCGRFALRIWSRSGQAAVFNAAQRPSDKERSTEWERRKRARGVGKSVARSDACAARFATAKTENVFQSQTRRKPGGPRSVVAVFREASAKHDERRSASPAWFWNRFSTSSAACELGRVGFQRGRPGWPRRVCPCARGCLGPAHSAHGTRRAVRRSGSALARPASGLLGQPLRRLRPVSFPPGGTRARRAAGWGGCLWPKRRLCRQHEHAATRAGASVRLSSGGRVSKSLSAQRLAHFRELAADFPFDRPRWRPRPRLRGLTPNWSASSFHCRAICSSRSGWLSAKLCSSVRSSAML